MLFFTIFMRKSLYDLKPLNSMNITAWKHVNRETLVCLRKIGKRVAHMKSFPWHISSFWLLTQFSSCRKASVCLDFSSISCIQSIIDRQAVVETGVELVKNWTAIAKMTRGHGIGPFTTPMTGKRRVCVEAYHILSHFVPCISAKSQGHWAAHWIGPVHVSCHAGEKTVEAGSSGWRWWRPLFRWTFGSWWVFQHILVFWSLGTAT